MAVRPVVRYPDPVLARPAAPVGDVGDRARSLAEDLVDTMRASPACVGLAAPQIEVGLRAFCVDVTGHRHATTGHGLVVLFDPEVLDSADPQVRREGCLSVPDLTADVARPLRLRVVGTTTEGDRLELEAEGFEARAFLHEMDHLDGLLILDRITSADGLFARRVYR